MAAGLDQLFDRRKLGRLKARFDAWWDGAEPAADDALFDAQAPETISTDPGAEVAPLPALPEPSPQPAEPDPSPPAQRLAALGLLWGEGRIFPGGEGLDRALLDRLDLAPSGMLAVLGPGGPGPVRVAAAQAQGAIRAYEWRAEAFGPLRAALDGDAEFSARGKLDPIDLDTSALPRDSFDGVVSYDEFTYAAAPARLALQLGKALNLQAVAALEWYAGEPGKELAPAFASAFAEPAVKPSAIVPAAMSQAGFEIIEDTDVTDEHLETVRDRLRALPDALDAAKAALTATALRELAWEAQSWAARRRLLASRRLSRRRLIARRV